jgi:hypothetical protein
VDGLRRQRQLNVYGSYESVSDFSYSFYKSYAAVCASALILGLPPPLGEWLLLESAQEPYAAQQLPPGPPVGPQRQPRHAEGREESVPEDLEVRLPF